MCVALSWKSAAEVLIPRRPIWDPEWSQLAPRQYMFGAITVAEEGVKKEATGIVFVAAER